MSVLYNENDPHAAAWLRRLVAAGHLPPGRVDSRSIVSLKPSDLDEYTSFHTFAGIGGWPLALRLAGWPDDRRVWTGSCPCQPFSSAGARCGLEDERHLWPAFFALIRECRPDVVLGEQVSSKDGLAWFDVVSADLEGEGYAVGALDTCAASVGAPHRRQRLFWVAYADEDGRLDERTARLHDQGQLGDDPLRRSEMCPWGNPDWVFCDDPSGARWRPLEPGVVPLADGVPERLGRLRGYGNAIVPQLGAAFVRSFMEVSAI